MSVNEISCFDFIVNDDQGDPHFRCTMDIAHEEVFIVLEYFPVPEEKHLLVSELIKRLNLLMTDTKFAILFDQIIMIGKFDLAKKFHVDDFMSLVCRSISYGCKYAPVIAQQIDSEIPLVEIPSRSTRSECKTCPSDCDREERTHTLQ